MLSAKTQYALLAMLQLAVEHADGQPVQVRRIAERHGISPTFLVQIMHELKRGGLAKSLRGAAGGYRLARRPEAVTVADVVDVFEPAAVAAAAGDSPLAAELQGVCRDLAQARRRVLQGTTLADLCRRAARHGEPMWYI